MQRNYASVAKGPMTRNFKINSIQSKAQLELGKNLSKEDVSKLAQRFTLDKVYETTEKVSLSCIR